MSEMDVVYVTREGENPELRYSLRSLVNVPHRNVWVVGGAPSWLNPETVNHRFRMQNGTPYRSTRGHIAMACDTPEISNPFVLWNDDFFAVKKITHTDVLHRGSLTEFAEKMSSGTAWSKSLRETARLISTWEKPDHVEWKSYDLHTPLIVYKSDMREALRIADKLTVDAAHLRTIYGNIAFEGAGTIYNDPKVLRRSDPFPRGPWLSSSDNTFLSTVEPVLRYLFPDPCIYEKG